MTGPAIHVVVKKSEFSTELVAWYFDEREANARCEELNAGRGEYADLHSVEQCPAGDPQPERPRW